MQLRRSSIIFTLVLVCAALSACHEPASVASSEGAVASSPERPRLAVVIVVDQMRADYLTRYRTHFKGGFDRLLTGGRYYPNAWVDHAYTNSLPGHTSILTGSYPRRHGLTDNVWREISPSGVELRGGFSLVDRRDGAPYGLEADTLPEWALAQDEHAKFAAIGSNDAPRIYAGRLRGPVFWFSRDEKGYVTNDNYATALPDWVRTFNDERLPELSQIDWQSEIPVAVIAQLRPDDSDFENARDTRQFPYRAPSEADEALSWLADTPHADKASLELAGIAVEKLGLGNDDVPDILAISLNSLDEIGHAYGPFSHEQTDAIFKLDAAIGEFMARLDAVVGPGKWVIALTADHGVATTPEQMRLNGSTAGRRVSKETARDLAEAAYAAADGIQDPAAKATAAARRIEAFDFVERAFTESEVQSFEPDPQTLEGLIALSYRPGRIPEHPLYIRELAVAALGVFVVPKEGVMMDWATAIHGSPYDYDRRVPLVFYGGAFSPATIEKRAATVDVAPTLAALIGITPSKPIDGVSLLAEEANPDTGG